VRVRGEALQDDLVDPGREGKGPLIVPENLIDQLLLLIYSLNHLLRLSLTFRLKVVVGIKPLKVGFFFEFEQNFGSLPVSVLSRHSFELFLEEVRGHVKLLGGESLLELLEVSSAPAEDQCMNYASPCLLPHGPLYLLIAGTLNWESKIFLSVEVGEEGIQERDLSDSELNHQPKLPVDHLPQFLDIK
jgi:hypothetical protein